MYNNSTEVWMPRSLVRLSNHRVDTGAKRFPSAKRLCNLCNSGSVRIKQLPSQLQLNSDMENKCSHRCEHCSKALPILQPSPNPNKPSPNNQKTISLYKISQSEIFIAICLGPPSSEHSKDHASWSLHHFLCSLCS